MPDIFLEVRDDSDVLQSQTDQVLYLEDARSVDQVGRVKFGVPVGDPVVDDLVIGNYAWLYIKYAGVSQASRAPVTIAGIYHEPKRSIIGGREILEIDTLNRTADLLYRFNAEDSRWTATALSTILGTGGGNPPGLLNNTGWTLSIEGGPGAVTANHEFQGESVLDAIRKVVEDALDGSDDPLHWWANPVNETLYVGLLGASSGIRFAQPSAPSPIGTAPTALLEKLEKRSTGEIINYLYVYGGSDGEDRLTLPSPEAGGAYTVQTGTSRMNVSYYYIKDTASITAYGEYRFEWTDNAANTRNLSTAQAQEALYRAGCSFLARRKDPHEAWSAVAVGDLDAIDPGESVKLWHKRTRTRETMTGQTQTVTLSIDQTVYVTKVTRRVDLSGDTYTFDLGSSLDHKIGSTRDEHIGRMIAAAVKAAVNRTTGRVLTAGAGQGVGFAPSDATYVTISAESGLSAETLHSAVVGALGASTELTIAAGVVTATGFYHTIDTQNNDASDDLDTINGGSAGDLLIIQAEISVRTVVVKDGTGNLKLAGDFSLTNTEDSMALICDGTNWIELSRSDNGL